MESPYLDNEYQFGSEAGLYEDISKVQSRNTERWKVPVFVTNLILCLILYKTV